MDDINIEEEWSKYRHLMMAYEENTLSPLYDPELIKIFESLGLIKISKNVTGSGLEIKILITIKGLHTK